MITALLDTNIILDVILDRPPFVRDSGAVWRACDLGQFSGYISGITPPTVYYVVERIRGRGIVLSAIDKCLAAFEISPVYRETLEAARRMNGPDFEDDIHIACAITSVRRLHRDPRSGGFCGVASAGLFARNVRPDVVGPAHDGPAPRQLDLSFHIGRFRLFFEPITSLAFG